MKILFVDDAPEIIISLQRMMHKSPWSVHFANGGMEALDMLADESFDVVVTDLNMPEVNGVKLLKIIQKEFPHLIRIVYSGSLSKESVRDVAAFTHRFISKPCSADKMMQTIQNTLFIHTVLDNDAIRTALTNTGTLPSLPRVYTVLMDQIENNDFSLRDAAELIASDIGMSANVLKQINLLGISGEISTVDQAVSLLGLNTIKAITLSSHIFSSLELKGTKHFTAEQLTRHCMLTAEFAKEITMIETDDKKMAESAYVAGVLHDLGILILADNFPEKYEAVMNRVFTAHRPISEVERNLIGISHGEIGAYLLALWGFPKEILTAVAFHEEPINHPAEGFELLSAVYIANFFAHTFAEDKPMPERYLEESKYLEQIECKGRVSFWEKRCREVFDSLPKN